LGFEQANYNALNLFSEKDGNQHITNLSYIDDNKQSTYTFSRNQQLFYANQLFLIVKFQTLISQILCFVWAQISYSFEKCQKST